MTRRKRTLPRGWYPFDGKDCRRDIESYLERWSPPSLPPGGGVGGIVPHAGWYFSGKLATRVFYSLKSERKVDLVVLYGGHLGSEHLPRVVTEQTWETPFGDLQLDTEFARDLTKRIEMKEEGSASGDNTIEVQLAMVKFFYPDSKLVAMRSPPSPKAEELGKEVAVLAQKKRMTVLAVGSTDLTHYGPNYGFLAKGIGPSSVEWVKKENDRGFVDRALKLDVAGLLKHANENASACSAGAAASAVATCKALGADKGILLDYYTSYDILPDASFVGYAGIVF
jgi:AmmeMemoRadiSam system protein B